MCRIAILDRFEYEYECRGGLSTSTRRIANKTLDRSAQSSVFDLCKVFSSPRIFVQVPYEYTVDYRYLVEPWLATENSSGALSSATRTNKITS